MTNYKLDTGKKYIKDLFASDSFYNVPEYQRPYVWGEDQISALLEDVSTAFANDKNKEYFLGCMIWNTKKVRDKNGIDYECHDILDGQQRFITIYILHGILRDLSNDKNLHKKVKDRMKQEEDKYDNIPERNRIVFQIRSDKDFIDKYLINESGTLQVKIIGDISNSYENGKSVRGMANAINFMHKWWNLKFIEIERENSIQDYLSDFFQYISNRVLALYLSTPDNLDDAYNLFTVLNSRGMQLKASDILKAQNLRQIPDEDIRKKYANKWEEYENSIVHPINSFDEFLWSMVYIKMKYRSDANTTLSKSFNFMYDKKLLERGTGTFDFIGKYINHLDAVTNNIHHSAQSGFLYYNLNFILSNTFGSAYLTPLMHYRECFYNYRIVDFLIKIDNLLSAYWLIDNRNQQSRIFIILRRMDELLRESNNIQEAADAFLDDQVLTYGYQDEKAATAININLLFNMLEEEKWGGFSGTRVNKTRYILLKLDILTGDINQKLYFNKNLSSIEHLMPQKVENTDWSIEEEEHKLWVHRLGNLALLDRRKNASMSNSTFNLKKDKYQEAIEGRSNTSHIFMKYSEWNLNNIESNHKRTISLLKDYYLGNELKTLSEIKKKAVQNQYAFI